ncbi:MAG: enoyl-CoA hydratase/isomerase family protein [Desulfobacterales bacterium]|nr:MAG: enoyl-CoA hydratase/isomerase family protein [Desulfobacterales bacterium]
MSAFVEITPHGNIAEVTLNRPEAYNAFDLEALKELARNLTSLASDQQVRGIVLTGRGPAFCAGGDLKFAVRFPGGAAAAFHAMAAQFHLAILEIRQMPKPVIAALNGVAAGGGFSLALACDLRVMARSAKMIQAYTSAGLCIDGGGTFTLPRLVGLARALEIAAFDKPITSEKALNWGLVTKVVQDGDASPEALDMARQLAERSLHAYGRCKKLLTDSFNTSLASQMELEREGLGACADHPDGQEGLKAFNARKKPKFT